MLDDQNLLVTQFLTLWAMLDPIGHLPLFLGATGDLSSLQPFLNLIVTALAQWLNLPPI